MRVGALAAALAAALGAAGCGGGESGQEPVRSIALLAPGSGNDLDWSRHARDAVEEIAEERRIAGLIADDVTAGQIPDAFRQLDGEGAELVFAHDPSYAPAAADAAEETGIPTLVWGAADAAEPGLVADVEVAAAEAGFVVGALTAHATSIKKVTVLIADDGTDWDARNWNLTAGGYIAGVRHELPEVEIGVRWVGGSDGTTFAEMKRTAAALLDRKVHTLFTLGGRSAIGALKAVDEEPGEEVYAGVIGDKMTVNTLSSVITSVLYDFDVLFRRAIADVRAGRFGERPYRLTFANGGLRLLNTGRTPSNAYDAGLAAEEALAGGEIELPETPTRADVLALLREPSR